MRNLLYRKCDECDWKLAVPNVEEPEGAVEWYSQELPDYQFRLTRHLPKSS